MLRIEILSLLHRWSIFFILLVFFCIILMFNFIHIRWLSIFLSYRDSSGVNVFFFFLLFVEVTFMYAKYIAIVLDLIINIADDFSFFVRFFFDFRLTILSFHSKKLTIEAFFSNQERNRVMAIEICVLRT